MTVRIVISDALSALEHLPDESVHCCVTSPPYWGLRSYGGESGLIGLEPTFDEHLENLLSVFREVRRVLRKDGTLWLNYGDAYANDGKWGGSTGGKHAKGLHGKTGVGRQKAKTGLKPKDLMMMPARAALALQADGWWLRSEIVWHKPDPMPESVTDRPTSAHEKMFLLSKSARYFYDAAAVRTPVKDVTTARDSRADRNRRGVPPGASRHSGIGKRRTDKQRGHSRRHDGFNDRWDAMSRGEQQANGANLRNVWRVATSSFRGAHFAAFPPALIEPCVRAGCPVGGVVLDPFGGSGTTGMVADRWGRDALLIEISGEYAEMARRRVVEDAEKEGGAFRVETPAILGAERGQVEVV